MKIIKIDGCGGCPYNVAGKESDDAVCREICEFLDMVWSVNPHYSHPDCPLEEVTE